MINASTTTAQQRVDYIVHDCLFAVGEAVGDEKQLDYEAIVWLRDRYREKFLRVMTEDGSSWDEDRERVLAVGRYLGRRAVHHAGAHPSIGRDCAALAAAEIEAGCKISRERLARGVESPA